MTKLDLHYTEPRLVELYDIENPPGPDFDFFLHLADELNAQRILDLGCGTGLLTRQLAVAGREVTGVDPAAAMLAYARRQPGVERVMWIEGDASALGTPAADLMLMTGNVAQVFLDDARWATTLRHAHDALRPGGHLVFESRNPNERGWERWNPETTFARLETPHGSVESWLEVVGVENGRVHFVGHNLFKNTGEDLVVASTLRFRSHEEIRTSLRHAGFTIEHVYGDWQQGPFVDTSQLMIFVARRDEQDSW
jgi:SAM-dependent methyltransferase